MILTQQPVPKTIEDLAHEVSEDALLARLELQRAAQEEAIRNYKADTVVVGAPKPQASESEGTEDDADESGSADQGYMDDDDDDEDEEAFDDNDEAQ